jgi:hypothetical protein
MEKVAFRLRQAAIDLVRFWPWLDSRLLIRRRERLAQGSGYPDWTGYAAAEAGEPAVADRGRRVLIATSIGSHLPAMHVETLLATALSARGAEVEVLLCDELLPGCQMCEPRLFPEKERFVRHGPQKDLCGHCFVAGKRVYEQLGVKVHAYSQTLTEADIALASRISGSLPVDQIEHYQLEGLKLGEHAKAGALRFFARATLDGEPTAEAVLRRYLKAALLTALSVRRLLERGRFDVAVFHHGIYVPQGVIGEVARSMGVRVVNWNPAYRSSCFLFSHADTYHHTLMTESIGVWENMPWSDARRQRIQTYLRSRWSGENDWIKFHQDPVFERRRILAEIGCDPDKPIIACLTNVMWDAQLHYPANAFPDMLEWLLHTVRYFAARPDLQLVIRVHPAELRGAVPTRQPVVDELARAFLQLPANVFVIGPESRISTYVLADLSDSVIIYGTKTGVELTSVGIPVIVAGEAWIRNKGVTADATSVAQYDTLLDALPVGKRLPEPVVERALRYAYHFFFRRMVPIELFDPGPGWPPYFLDTGRIETLGPGRYAGLDCICDGILKNTPFVYDPRD